jgi:serine/threonine protein kinase/tetratricopeptide (TPR) repeat protein
MNPPVPPALPAAALDPEDVGTVRNLAGSQVLPQGGNLEAAQQFGELARSDSAAVERLRQVLQRLPIVGDWFAGFELVAVLGHGAFGRVYLARQRDLAARFVALKVSTDLAGESRTLARLQHTNIVPIYSVHHVAPFQAVCMPYFGATTLAHLLACYRRGQSLPASGRQLVNTLCVLNDRTGPPSGMHEAPTRAAEPGAPVIGEKVADAGTLPPRAGTQGFLGLLRSMTYPDAVCWIGAQLADGLSHAHERGLIHNDLKPANILLTDEGRPMLLDFGVADDLSVRASATVARIGGTLPFMSPEHIDSIQYGTPVTDPRSDIYGLGIILYEMLTGQHPFRFPTEDTEVEIPKMLAERRAGPPQIVPHNPAVTPGLEAIIRKCLEPDPEKRYQSAAQVREDLERHRHDQPLLHVSVPSVRERLAKWARRHPRLASNLCMATVSLVLLALCGVGLYARGARVERLEAVTNSQKLTDDLQVAHFMLNARTLEPDTLKTGIERCEAALTRYGLPEDAEWDSRPNFRALPIEEQEQVRAHLVEACAFLARGYAFLARSGAGDGEGHSPQLQHALELNTLAERIAGDDVPKSVLEQRADLLKRLGRSSEAEKVTERSKKTPLRTARDYYLAGSEALAAGQRTEAQKLLAQSVDLDPTQYWAHMTLGASYEALAQFPAAAGCYDTAIALRPNLAWGYYNRGRVALTMRDYEKARTSLDKSAALAPNDADVYLHRALAHQELREFNAALKDLDKAIELGASKARATFMRASVHELAGNKEEATRDLEVAMELEPTDEITWLARGYARRNSKPLDAIKDFDSALAINARSLTALQNKSSVLSSLNQSVEAIKVLDKEVELYPEYTPARAGRGVLHARLGNWDAAKKDAEEAIKQDGSPSNMFQVAGIYALLTKHDPTNKDEAIRLLSAAIRGGFGHDLIDDEDLAPIFGTPEYKRIAEGVRLLGHAKQ